VGAIVGQDVSIQFKPATREVVEGRLKKYGGNDAQRERTLKGLFVEAGCEEINIVEQPVQGWPLPNVICTLPGSSDRTIIVGAHYDHISPGDGVVDNWSGAALLPSLVFSLSAMKRHHTFVFVGFTAEEKGEIGSEILCPANDGTAEGPYRCDGEHGLRGWRPRVWQTYADRKLISELRYILGQ
jgi:hypothetical protein